jgi:hypothetical protein
MKTKTYSYKGRLYSEIPKEAADALKIKSGDEIEFTSVYENLVLIAPVKAAAKKETKEDVNAQEIALLQKVNSIRHYDRTYNNILKMLDTGEAKMLDDLFKRDVLFEYNRSGKKLVGIDKKYFKYIIEEKDEQMERLLDRGYLVIEDQEKAKNLTDKLKKDKLPVRGIRGFDKRYYIVSAEKLEEIRKKLEKILTKEKPIKTISSELGVAEELCKAALEILLADGEIFEKRKNIYVLA